MLREELRSGWKEDGKSVGEGGLGALHWLRGGKKDQIERRRYTCWGPEEEVTRLEGWRLQEKLRSSKDSSRSESCLEH